MIPAWYTNHYEIAHLAKTLRLISCCGTVGFHISSGSAIVTTVKGHWANIAITLRADAFIQMDFPLRYQCVWFTSNQFSHKSHLKLALMLRIKSLSGVMYQTSPSDIHLGQLFQVMGCCLSDQAITFISVDLSSLTFIGTHLRSSSQEVCKISIRN